MAGSGRCFRHCPTWRGRCAEVVVSFGGLGKWIMGASMGEGKWGNEEMGLSGVQI